MMPCYAESRQFLTLSSGLLVIRNTQRHGTRVGRL